MPTPDFERLVAEHAQSLYGFLAYRPGDPVSAEAVLTETLARAAPRFSKRGAGGATTWLLTLALSTLRERRTGSNRFGPERQTTAELLPDGPGWIRIDDTLLRALDALDEDEREVIALRYGADLPPAAIANVTRSRLPRVQQQLYSGLRKMQAVLARDHVQAP